MLETIPITTRPLAPPCPTGRPGGFGLWEAVASFPNGAIVWAGGHGEASARRNLDARMRQAWEELRDHLTAVELERDAEEAGDLDPYE